VSRQSRIGYELLRCLNTVVGQATGDDVSFRACPLELTLHRVTAIWFNVDAEEPLTDEEQHHANQLRTQGLTPPNRPAELKHSEEEADHALLHVSRSHVVDAVS